MWKKVWKKGWATKQIASSSLPSISYLAGYDDLMHLYLAAWTTAFVVLLLAIAVTIFIYRWIGDGLDLNRWHLEIATALVVSAGQAGGYLLEQRFPVPQSYQLRIHGSVSIAAPIFIACLWLGYKITHLTAWDDINYLILVIADSCLAFFALIAFG